MVHGLSRPVPHLPLRRDPRTSRRIRGAHPMTDITPEWAMIGWQADGWHYLLASRHLTHAQLDWVAKTYNYASWDAFLQPGAFAPDWHIDITGTGGRQTVKIIKNRSYAECLADLLFTHGWRADTPQGELPTHDPIRGHLAAQAATTPQPRIIEGRATNHDD